MDQAVTRVIFTPRILTADVELPVDHHDRDAGQPMGVAQQCAVFDALAVSQTGDSLGASPWSGERPSGCPRR
jgi:hypothetical protein